MSLFEKFRNSLKKTAVALTRGIAGLFSDTVKWDAATFLKLENTLIEADFGCLASKRVAASLKERYDRGELNGTDDIMKAASAEIADGLKRSARPIRMNPDGLTVILFAGVNGSGKTTTIGKLAMKWQNEGKKVVLGACDTFRAAAAEQLKLWADRTGAQIVFSKQGADPSAVAYDAVKASLARNADLLLIDTAGRQHTRKDLMEELTKLKRTIGKLCPEAPQEVWLTVDASTGTNTVAQCREFSEAAGITGLVLTKLDGTGKGGAVVGIQNEFSLPVFFTGLGEQPEDLQEFDPDQYAQAVFLPAEPVKEQS